MFCSSGWYPSICATLTFISSLLFNGIHLYLYSSSLITVFMNKFKIVKYYHKAQPTQAQCHLWISWKSLPVRFLSFKVSKNISVPVEMPASEQPIFCCPLWSNCSKGWLPYGFFTFWPWSTGQLFYLTISFLQQILSHILYHNSTHYLLFFLE